MIPVLTQSRNQSEIESPVVIKETKQNEMTGFPDLVSNFNKICDLLGFTFIGMK